MYTQAQLGTLNEALGQRCDELMVALNIDVTTSGNYRFGPCQIHGGDNLSGLNIYPAAPKPFWRCMTQQCQKFFKGSLIGMVRGRMSHLKYDWTSPRDRYTFSFSKTLSWCEDFVGAKLKDIRSDDGEAEQDAFVRLAQKLGEPKLVSTKQISRDFIRGRLLIPSEYLLERGFTADLLRERCIGDCRNDGKPFRDRVVIPIFDNEDKYVVGFTARSRYVKCDKCGLYHIGPCPVKNHHWFTKWRHSKDVQFGNILFNFAQAKRAVQKCGALIVVEGPLDALRLIQAGYENVVALMGASFSDRKMILTERLSPRKIIVWADNDEAGKLWANEAYEKLKNLYELRFVECEKHDAADCGTDEVKEILCKF